MMDFRRDLVSDVQFGGEELSEALCWRIARGASSPVHSRARRGSSSVCWPELGLGAWGGRERKEIP